ncbi:MAG TPA: phosphatase PAP2 family protein [Candidatus Sulfotelmatobacter sp.]|jgi:membrane-associated phospholipid phosphatase|nr:phosphatase PAP2 family protein [Candidatus Sulfotelmatobacter sp.]
MARSGFNAAIIVLMWLGLIATSILWLDRPWAEFAYASQFKNIAVIRMLTEIAELGGSFSLAGLALAAFTALRGWRSPMVWRILLALLLALLVAGILKSGLKLAFSRTWPETWVENNPSWIRDGVFVFDFFHGGRGWGAFPSGHSTMIAAPMTVLWCALPRWRWLNACPVALVAAGLLLCDYHWISDVVAGIGLGIACGFAVWRLSAHVSVCRGTG